MVCAAVEEEMKAWMNEAMRNNNNKDHVIIWTKTLYPHFILVCMDFSSKSKLGKFLQILLRNSLEWGTDIMVQEAELPAMLASFVRVLGNVSASPLLV